MKTKIGKAISTMLSVVTVAAIVIAGNVSASGTPAFNVALNAGVTLHGGSFFTGGWGAGLVVSKDTVVDGVFLPKFNQWDQGAVWWDCHDWLDRYIIIDLGDVYSIESLIVQADDNDAYLLYYWDMATTSWELAWHVPNYDFYQGVDLWGMQTRPNPDNNSEKYFLPQKIVTNTLMFKGDMASGDFWFAVSEIQAYGYLYRCIDVKPGSYPNSINLDDKGLLPVAILGNGYFDVTWINPEIIELGGVGMTSRGKAAKLAYSFEDVNGDGFIDLSAFFSIPELVANGALTEATTGLTLTATLYNGTPIEGTDSVRVVPP